MRDEDISKSGQRSGTQTSLRQALSNTEDDESLKFSRTLSQIAIRRTKQLVPHGFLSRSYPIELPLKQGSIQKKFRSPIERDHGHHEKNFERSWRQKRLTGWKMGAICSCSIAFAILLVNTSVFLWATSNHKVVNGSGTLFQGNCAEAKRTNTFVQVGINVLATLLLGASNYCMQCLSAPTREEVDSAHAKKEFLHIGVPSFTNLKKINRPRMIVWVLLGLSALPIHFL